jgi:hypothetical protein
MAVPALSIWVSTFEALPPTMDASAGVHQIANALGDLMDQVQASSQGTIGIFTFNREIFATQLLSLPFVSDTSWVSPVVMAWETAVGQSTITPGTVTDSGTWPFSQKDILTAGTGSAVIANLSAASGILQSELLDAASTFAQGTATTYTSSPALKAFRDATLTFSFTCTGLVDPTTSLSKPYQAL